MLHKRLQGFPRTFTNTLGNAPPGVGEGRTCRLWLRGAAHSRMGTSGVAHKASRISEQAATFRCQLRREELANGRGAIVAGRVVKVKKLPIRGGMRVVRFRHPKHRQSHEHTNPL